MLDVLNDDGRPRVVAFPAGSAREGPQTAAVTVARALRVPCAVAGDVAFCPDRTGEVRRSKLAGGEAKSIASSRAGSRIAASRIGATPVVAYLASRQTSEGWVREAWITTEEGRPQRLSEDGSGATFAALSARGSSVLALTVDSRVALTAMHAREIRFDKDLRLGEDVVVFVGGPGAPRSEAALAVFPSSVAYALLPIERDILSFGLAIVKLDEPLRVDEPVSWSVYADGLDPAPVATAWAGDRMFVARVRPRAAGPGAPRDIEIGELSSGGAFSVRQTIVHASDGGPTDVALSVDPRGTLWLAWLDSAGSWIERLACP
jgi:hypothetical protein